MATLPIDSAVPRFQTNESRFDTFVNGGVTASWTTSGGSRLPSIAKYLADKTTEINVGATSVLALSTAAKDAAEVAAAEAVAAAETATWIAESVVTGRFVRTVFQATAGQTTKTVSYDVGFVDVYVNGFRLVVGTDFIATNGTSITFTDALNLNDDVEIIAFGNFVLPNAVQKSANLSDLSSIATALANLGATSVGTSVFKASDTAAARTAIGLGNASTAGFLDEDDFASDSATAAPSQQSTKAYVDTAVAALPFTKGFTSTEQTLAAGGLITVAHGLGVMPKLITVRGKCIAADNGYAVGDLIELDPLNNTDSATSCGNALWSDATNVYYRFNSGGIGFLVANKNTGAAIHLTTANWKIIIGVYA